MEATRADLEASHNARRADLPTVAEPNAAANAVDYAKFYSRSHRAVIRVYDEAGNVIETHEQVAVAALSIPLPKI